MRKEITLPKIVEFSELSDMQDFQQSLGILDKRIKVRYETLKGEIKWNRSDWSFSGYIRGYICLVYVGSLKDSENAIALNKIHKAVKDRVK